MSGETEVVGENLPQYRSVHRRFTCLESGSNPGRRNEKSATNRLSYGTGKNQGTRDFGVNDYTVSKESHVLGCGAVLGLLEPMFGKNLSPSFSGWKE
jgi:hypothetical protein